MRESPSKNRVYVFKLDNFGFDDEITRAIKTAFDGAFIVVKKHLEGIRDSEIVFLEEEKHRHWNTIFTKEKAPFVSWDHIHSLTPADIIRFRLCYKQSPTTFNESFANTFTNQTKHS